MAYGYLLAPSFQFVNINGRPLVGGHIEVFIHNTDTKYITKADFDGTDNPFEVPLNSKGMAVIIASGDFSYDVFCYDRFGSPFWSGINVAIDNSSGLVIEGAELPMRIVGGKITNNGKELTCTGENAWAEGAETTASGANAHAEGGLTTASGEHSHSEGFKTTASSGYSHAEGAGSKATNSASHAEGQDTTASGQASHAEGRGSVASGNYSHASGRGTRATNEGSHAVGRWNDDGDAFFVVGDGTNDNQRHDAFKVDRNGDTWVSINGVLTKVTNVSGSGGGGGFDFCINGGFTIWQKGTSFDIGKDNAITADMWRVNSFIDNEDPPLTNLLVTKDYDAPDNLLTDCCVKIMPKSSIPTLNGNVEGHIRQGIDGERFRFIFGKKLVCSFWVKSNLPGVYSIACVNYATTKSYIKEYMIDTADTWEHKELVFSFEDLDPADWEFGNDGAVRFRFELYNNGDVVAPNTDTWLDGNYCGSQNQVNFISSASNYFKLAQVKFEVNSYNKATPYVQKLESVELLSCQKYYQLIPLSVDFNAYSTREYYSVSLPLYTVLLKEPTCKVVNDYIHRQPIGGYNIAYPGADGTAAKDVQLEPLTFIYTPVQITGSDNLIHAVRARVISTGAGRNALHDLLVELDATI